MCANKYHLSQHTTQGAASLLHFQHKHETLEVLQVLQNKFNYEVCYVEEGTKQINWKIKKMDAAKTHVNDLSIELKIQQLPNFLNLVLTITQSKVWEIKSGRSLHITSKRSTTRTRIHDCCPSGIEMSQMTYIQEIGTPC